MKTNWKTKLKTVLEKDKISEVSTKTELRLTAETHSDVVSAVNHSSELVDTSRNFDELTELKSDKLHAHLNRFIENGFKFEVLADFFIGEQTAINEYNNFVDSYNAKVDEVLRSAEMLNDFETVLEEQKAILIYDGGFSEEEAEASVCRDDNVRRIIFGKLGFSLWG